MPIQRIDFVGNLLAEREIRPVPSTQTDLKPWNRHRESKVLARYGPNALLNFSHTSVPVRLWLSNPSDTGLESEHFHMFPIQNILVRFASYLLHPAEPNDLISNSVGLPRTERDKCILDAFGHLVGLDMSAGGDEDLKFEDSERNYCP